MARMLMPRQIGLKSYVKASKKVLAVTASHTFPVVNDLGSFQEYRSGVLLDAPVLEFSHR